MFNLTPQEKSVLSGLLTVCLLGTLIHCGLNCDARPFRWVNTVSQKPDAPPSKKSFSGTSSKKPLKKTPKRSSRRKHRE